MAIVTVDYSDLQKGVDLCAQIKEAYGEDGLGIMAITNVPNLEECRERALAHSFSLGQLSKETLAKYEVPPYYQRGWSCGQEKMKDGTPDFNKGSFYFNPVRDSFHNPQGAEDYPTFYGTNVWPTTELGSSFETDLKTCSKLMIDVAKLVARQCDNYVRQELKSAFLHSLEAILTESQHPAARLLHYFARSDNDEAGLSASDGWCGWHNDHGTLTALLPALYQDSKSGDIIPNPDPEAGLYIKNRKGDVVKAKPPSGCLLVQMGETAQIHTGGILKATPHMVRAVSKPNVARATMAVFTEPGHGYAMSLPTSRTQAEALRCEHLPEGVPTLESRWQEGISFGDFGNKTIQAYYQ
eukprot:TRINITY_DN705_c0_g1_i1.p1 TRINITY_DN705_c0_g1~~TRINITY_DN705_c0_g1_i1.p1  ORF type:complete len:354 (+),score=52.23 TRINITY_DN705_c0_g1_i1:53-1114(+)